MSKKEISAAEISRLMAKMGIQYSLYGYDYIRDAIKLIVDRKLENRKIKIIREIYSALAEKYNTTWNGIERGISNAIEKTFAYGNYDMLDEIFSAIIDPDKGKCTNKVFLHGMAEYMLMNYENKS